VLSSYRTVQLLDLSSEKCFSQFYIKEEKIITVLNKKLIIGGTYSFVDPAKIMISHSPITFDSSYKNHTFIPLLKKNLTLLKNNKQININSKKYWVHESTTVRPVTICMIGAPLVECYSYVFLVHSKNLPKTLSIRPPSHKQQFFLTYWLLWIHQSPSKKQRWQSRSSKN